VDSFTAGTQTRASRARKSSVTHKSAITDHAVEENHVIDWDKAVTVKFRVNYGGGNGAGYFEVKVWADTAKFTDVIVTRLRKCSDVIREGKVFVENKTKVASGVGCSERAVLYFTELLFTSNKKTQF